MRIAKADFHVYPGVESTSSGLLNTNHTGFCGCLHCSDSVTFSFDVFVKALLCRLKHLVVVWLTSTEEESNGTIALLLVYDFSLGSAVEAALLEAGCYVSCQLHTWSVQ